VNYTRYGFWGYSETLDRDMNRVMDTLSRIRTEEPYPYNAVTVANLRLAYRVSPRLRELRNEIEALWDDWQHSSSESLMGMPPWYVEKHLTAALPGMDHYFRWLLGDALQAGGFYADGFPRQYLRETADELEAACRAGTLDCAGGLPMPLLGRVRRGQLEPVARLFAENALDLLQVRLQTATVRSVDPSGWQAWREEFEVFRRLAHNPIELQLVGQAPALHELAELGRKVNVMRQIESVYRLLTLPCFVAAVPAWLWITARHRGRLRQRGVVLLLFCISLFCVRLAALAAYSVTRGGPMAVYSESAYPYQYAALFLAWYLPLQAWSGSRPARKPDAAA